MEISRSWAMPSKNTFQIPPISRLLGKYINGSYTVLDPFAGNSGWGTTTNDLNPNTGAQFHREARSFLRHQIYLGNSFDVVLLDPPYSPRQIQEVYQSIGKSPSKQDTQNSKLMKDCKDLLARLLKPSGLAICCGWNTVGFGKARGFTMLNVLIVCHGGAHNDTLVTVERYQPETTKS